VVHLDSETKGENGLDLANLGEGISMKNHALGVTAFILSLTTFFSAPKFAHGGQYFFMGSAQLVPNTEQGNPTPAFSVDQTGSWSDPTVWDGPGLYSPPTGVFASSAPGAGDAATITGFPADYDPPQLGGTIIPGEFLGFTGNGFNITGASGTIAYLGVAGPGTMDLGSLDVTGSAIFESVGGIPNFDNLDNVTGYDPSAETISGGSLSTPALELGTGTSLAPGNGVTSLLPDPTADAGSLTFSGVTLSGDVTGVIGAVGGYSIAGSVDPTEFDYVPVMLDDSTLNAKTELDIIGDDPTVAPDATGMTTLAADDSTITAGAVVIATGAGVASPLQGPAYGTGAAGAPAALTLDDGSILNANNTGDSPPSLVVGDTGEGTLSVMGGSTVNSQQSVIGNDFDSTGDVTIDDSTWNNASFLTIGNEGEGTLTVQDDAQVISKDVMYIGLNGLSMGTLAISDGGTVTTYTTGMDGPNSTVLGTDALSTGYLTIDGAGSQLESTGDMQIGYGGDGTATIADGGALIVDGPLFRIGHDEDSTGMLTVTGDGSSVTASDATLYIGYQGTGTADVYEGASLTVQATDIGTEETGVGTLNIDGAGTQATLGDVTVGDSGTGMLSITGGATVNTGDITVGSESDDDNSILIDGANTQVTAAGDMTVGDQGVGNVEVSNGATLGVNTLTVGNGDTGNGELDVYTGGNVTTQDNTTVAAEEDSQGEINVDGTNSILTVQGDLTIGGGGTGSLNVSGNATVTNQNATVGDDETSMGTVLIFDAAATWHTYGDLTIGEDGIGEVTVEDGATLQVDGDLTIGHNEGSEGTLTIDGTATTFTFGGGDVTIGSSGTGTMTVQNAAFVDLSGNDITLGDTETGDGLLTVTDPSSTLNTGDLTVAGSGTGSLTVQNAGTLSSGSVTIGDMEDSTGTATVTDSGSTWTASDLTVGGGGGGTLNIESGGVVNVNSTELAIGDEMSGSGTVTLSGAGSQLNFTGELKIGENGTGVFAVQGGASFTAKSVAVGDKQGSNGTLNVDGNGTFMEIQTDFNIGENGGGTLNVTNGANLLNDGDATVADMTGSSGGVTIDTGSAWNIGGNLTVANQGIGTMTVKAGSTVTANGVTLGTVDGAGGTLTVTGQTEEPSQLQYMGTLQVGDGGNGELDVLAGGQVEPTTNGTGIVEVAAQTTSTSTLSVQGYRTQLTANSLSVGGTTTEAGGAGMLIVSTEAEVTVSSMMHIWPGGTVDVSNGGSVTIGIGVPVLTGTVEVGGGGTLAGGGTVVGDLSSDGGTIAPGDLVTEAAAGPMNPPNGSPPPPPTFDVAPLDVDGDFDQNGGTIEMEFYGPTLPEYSQIQAVGDVDIDDPVMDLMFEDDYAPKSGDTFYLFVSQDDNINVSNFQLNVEGLQPGYQFQTQVNQQTGAFELIAVTNDEPIPEPTGMALLGLGSCVGALTRRWRRKG
jgi:T5SS/PEP-CTERM-associated repeat protein